jgi:hypothetical protein
VQVVVVGCDGVLVTAHDEDAPAAPNAPLLQANVALPVKLAVLLVTLVVLPETVVAVAPLHVLPVTVHVSV